MKISLIFSVSHLNLVLKLCLGAKPTKVPVAMKLNFGHHVPLGGKRADIFMIRIIAYAS